MRIFCLLAGTAAIAAALFAAAGPARAADAAAGEEVFLRVGCYTCHGYQGQGASTGPRLAHTQLSLEALSTFVRNTSENMPPFTPEVLSDAELADIYAYLQSVPEPPDPASIPILQQ